ncbi:ABC transporter permease [Affinibrenneria salicis]|uniref:ABC transporter permease n=1 Tax=Affinibrenneria salicis TaxID=2590031 RepID=A0A5J5G517_9GAMM|nr:ABC transporter permease [Affinibrenneria salicis]KAA9001314.1 ABC transporter permease [Affinibrenneria salicis]
MLSQTRTGRDGIGVPALIDKIPLLLFAALLLFLCVQAPYFLSWQNGAIILRQTAPLAILSCGLACVIRGGGDDVIAGGIDLSLPAIAVLAVAILSHGLTGGAEGYVWPALLALGAALLAGALNVALVVGIGLPPLLATLACSVALTGLTNWLTGQRRISVDDPAVAAFRDNSLFGLPLAVWFMLLVFAAFQFIIHHSRWGQHLLAAGGNPESARMSGLSVSSLVAGSYLLAALAAALASLTLLAQGSGSSPGTAEPLLLEMVLATFIGASFSRRRVVTLWGALLGALLVNALSNGLALLRVDIFWLGAIKGALILLVLGAASIRQRRRGS